MIVISNVRFVPAGCRDARDGLVGWASVTVNGGLRIDGIAVRRSASGRLGLSFPAHRDRRGRRHYVARPLDDATRREFERAILRVVHQELAL